MTDLVATERLTPLDVMGNLVLENGECWGDVAADFQVADAKAIFDKTGPLWHFLTRPRGGAKTSDLAGICLAWLVSESRTMQTSYIVATSEDQATELMDAAKGFIVRTPILRKEISADAMKLYGRNGATVEVLTSEGSSAWGKGRDTGFMILDEFAQWPETRKYRSLWVAMLSAAAKTEDLRLVILTSAGEPGHFSYGVLKEARDGETRNFWHVSETPGLVPWASEERIRAQSPHLTDSEFQRLHYNIWTEEDDRLLTEGDWEDAAVLRGHQMPKKGTRYIITVDLGVHVDPTVVVVSHVEPLPEDPKARLVVVDHLHRWVPKVSRKANSEVNLSAVEKYLIDLSATYFRAPIHGDPSQFVQMRQDLTRMGLMVKDFKFTSTSVGELGSVLVQAIQNRQLHLPNINELRDELLNVRLRATSPGVYRLDHDPKRHDDQAIAIGMAVRLWLGKNVGSARQFMSMVKDGQNPDARAAARERRLEREAARTSASAREMSRVIGRSPKFSSGDGTCVHGVRGRCIRCAGRRAF